ncbi:type IV pilus secretin PilQ [Candidatus Pelagibacter sp.]|nr:type IV pilus secretin PilQ [Candidatus Pelagibacter sp.]
MNIKKILYPTVFIVILLIVSGCAKKPQNIKTFKHNTPLIKKDIKATGKAEIEKTLEMGPKPVEGDIIKLQKRKKISSEAQRNYLLIPEDFPLLKQRVTLNFKNLDFKETMTLMGKIGEINVLVGDEVAGAISAELINVPWDKAFQALLDMKNYASDIDVNSNLIRVHSPETLTAQETYKSERASAVRKKVELEDSVEPIYSEIFRLYYISPAQAKETLTELFSSGEGENSFSAIQITEEQTTRSIIIRGKEKDLDVVDKVIKEIDVRTKQVLIEAFLVTATSEFERALGTRIGAYRTKAGEPTIGGLGGGNAPTDFGVTSQDAGGFGAAAGDILDTGIAGTSGIGVLKRTTTSVLKAEINALENLGLGQIISNPKIFTLDNQTATVTQGTEIPYTTISDGAASTSFKEAALKLEVTPSIVGDGNVLMTIKVNNDSVKEGSESDEPPVSKMEIDTRLLVADGDIVVIGGIKESTVNQNTNKVPALGDVPVIGNLFKGSTNSDDLSELLVFIAPRVL